MIFLSSAYASRCPPELIGLVGEGDYLVTLFGPLEAGGVAIVGG